MATHSSTLAWKIPWTEEPGGLQSMGSLRARLSASPSLFTLMHWRKKWKPTPVFLPGESQRQWAPVYEVAQSRTRLKWLSSSSSMYMYNWTLHCTAVTNTVSQLHFWGWGMSEFFRHVLKLSNLLNVVFPSIFPCFWSFSAKSLLQLCPTLCDPRDGSPPDSPVPGILQARTLEWVAISFSSAWKWKAKVKSLSRVRPSATPYL